MIDYLITAAAAQSAIGPVKDPMAYPAIVYLWVLVWSGIGGVVSFVAKMKRGDARPFNIIEFIGEIGASAFIGLLSFWLCEYYDVPKLIEAVIISISGHMGTRGIFMLEKYLAKRFGIDPADIEDKK